MNDQEQQPAGQPEQQHSHGENAGDTSYQVETSQPQEHSAAPGSSSASSSWNTTSSPSSNLGSSSADSDHFGSSDQLRSFDNAEMPSYHASSGSPFFLPQASVQANMPNAPFPFAEQYSGGHFGQYPAGFYAPVAKKKRMWSTTTLVLATVTSLLFGGIVGGLTGSFLTKDDDYYSREYGRTAPEQSESNQVPQFPGIPNNQGNVKGVDSGTKVDKAPGVVLINSKLYYGQGAGTGVVIDSSGIVVTNYHVVKGSTTVTVSTADGASSYEATVIGHNEAKDIAVLQITNPPKNLETVSIAKKSASTGDTVYAQGNGSGQGYITELKGKVTALNQSITASNASNREDSNRLTGLIETDADVVSGYSGGPLMNEDHEVVGINTAASSGETSEAVNGYAIPIAKVMSIVEQIRNGDTSNGNVIGPNAALGVTVTTVNGTYGNQNVTGAQIQGIVQGSGAEAAGLQKGDVILALDGNPVSSSSDLAKSIKSKAIGDKVKLTIISASDGSQKDVEVTLGKASVN